MYPSVARIVYTRRNALVNRTRPRRAGRRFETKTASAALGCATGAHFLPFDVDNFEYSTQSGFRLRDLQDEFRALNRLVYEADSTLSIQEPYCRDMPHAEVTRNNFWRSAARRHLIGRLNLPTDCN